MSDLQDRGMDELIQILITTKLSLDELTNKFVRQKKPMSRDEVVRLALEIDTIRVNVRVVYKELVNKFPEEYRKIIHTPVPS